MTKMYEVHMHHRKREQFGNIYEIDIASLSLNDKGKNIGANGYDISLLHWRFVLFCLRYLFNMAIHNLLGLIATFAMYIGQHRY